MRYIEAMETTRKKRDISEQPSKPVMGSLRKEAEEEILEEATVKFPGVATAAS